MKPLTLRAWLALLILVTVLPVLAFTVGLVVWHSHTEQELLRQQAARTANAAMQAIDRELSGAITGLQVLAASPALQGNDFEAFYAQAKAAVGIAGNSVIILYERNGNRVISTAVPYGEPIPPRKDMSALAPPFDTGQPYVSPLFMSETVKRPTLGVVVPVPIRGEIRYVLAAGLLSDALSDLLTKSGVPGEWVSTLLDQDGTVIARTRNQRQAVGKKALPDNWARIQSGNAGGTSFEGATQEGAPVFLTYARSGKSGWTTVIGIPIAELQGQLRRSLLLVAAIGLGVLALAALFAWWAAKHIYWPTSRLEVAAKALEDGKAVDLPSTGIQQFDRVGQTMHNAALRIEDREARLSQSLAELQHANEALQREDNKKDQFIATLAHELRNPLAPIVTAVYILKQAPSRDVLDQTVEMMSRQLRHMTRLIDDLLDVSRITRGKIEIRKEDVVLQAIITHTLEGIGPLLKEGGQALTVNMPEDPIRLNADATRVSQVIGNVVTNAIKFTPPDGSITITVTKEETEASIRVDDTGIGIPRDKLDDIFDLFVQVKDDNHRSQPGLGLGLSLARLLVELQGGSIDAYSEGSGEGATFVIRLPLSHAAELPARVVTMHPSPRTPGRRVLVVDDNADAADTLATALRMSGHTAYVAHDPYAGLKIAEECAVDVALIDIGMPGMDGYELCRRLREMPSFARVTIVAVTGWGAATDRAKASDAGFDAHLTKPVSWQQIESVMSRISRRA